MEVAMAKESAGSNGGDGSGRAELERFEALARKLVTVPKAELDAARKRAKKVRSRLAAR